MNNEKSSKCCNYPTYEESGDCGMCGQATETTNKEHLGREKKSKCCNAPITTKTAVEYAEGYELSEIEKIGKTNFNICTNCNNACDVK